MTFPPASFPSMELPQLTLYQMVVQNLPDIAILVFNKEFRYVLSEGAFLETMGAIPHEVIGKTLWEVFPPEMQVQLLPHFKAALEGQSTQFEVRRNQFIFRTQAVPVHDNLGAIVAGMIVAQNITAEKQQEEALRNAEQLLEDHANFLQGLIDAIPNPIFYKDMEGRYQGCNTTWLKYLGKTREEVLGKSVYDLNPKELADIYYAKDQEVYQQPDGIQVYESQVRNADGTSNPVIFSKAIIHNNDGSPWGLVGVITDITEGCA